MARYIDADEVLDAMLIEMAGTGYQSRAMDVIKYAETADVVPKSEVEKIFEEIENNSFEYGVNFLISKELIAELKKKYAESEDSK